MWAKQFDGHRAELEAVAAGNISDDLRQDVAGVIARSAVRDDIVTAEAR
jgi:hypothetical protein